MKYRAMIFDFFGVVCSEIAPFWLAQYFGDSAAVRIKDAIVHPADLGSVSQAEMFSSLAKIARIPAEQVEREWISRAQINLEVVELIIELKHSYKLGLLTNSPSAFVRQILESNSLTPHFEAIVVSSEHRCAKPDPAIYRIMLSAMNVEASDALMIDDNAVNVAGATAIGMGGLLFTSYPQLRVDLAQLT